MIILDQKNSYGFSNAVITVIDETVIDPVQSADKVKVRDFNVLIPTVQDVGVTNMLEYYEPGDVDGYVAAHGTPNPLKYGFAPDFIHGVLSRGKSDVGVYTINLRGPSATMANVITRMKYRVENDVPYTDTEGNQYYLSEDGQVSTDPDGEPIVRDVLHIKFENGSVEECRRWVDMHRAMNMVVSEEEDDEGYRTIPWFGILYRGATAYANGVYFNLTPTRAEYDGNMYYKVNMFNGSVMRSSDPTFSFDNTAGQKYNTTYFIEDLFNQKYPNMRYMTAESAGDMVDLIQKYLYTLDDYISGNQENPSVKFAEIDPFNVAGFAITVDEGSLNPELTKAFHLSNGSNGTESRDELYRMFFAGEILGDIRSPLRYRISYIPDVGYDSDTKSEIVTLVRKRNHMTTATLMLGSTDSFNSAVIDHQANYHEDMPNIRQLAAYQSPMMMNPFIRRTIVYPGTYFDTMALMELFAVEGNPYQPAAGADVRWTGYIEDTMPYPSEDANYLQSLTVSRINVVMKDSEDGAYLSDQLMNTRLTSDQTELNNAFLISSMLYDVVQIIHKNHFKFNEAEHVRIFSTVVDECVNSKYAQHSASIHATVQRVATTGADRSRNKIIIRVDLKDINKWTDVDLYLVDE